MGNSEGGRGILEQQKKRERDMEIIEGSLYVLFSLTQTLALVVER